METRSSRSSSMASSEHSSFRSFLREKPLKLKPDNEGRIFDRGILFDIKDQTYKAFRLDDLDDDRMDRILFYETIMKSANPDYNRNEQLLLWLKSEGKSRQYRMFTVAQNDIDMDLLEQTAARIHVRHVEFQTGSHDNDEIYRQNLKLWPVLWLNNALYEERRDNENNDDNFDDDFDGSYDENSDFFMPIIKDEPSMLTGEDFNESMSNSSEVRRSNSNSKFPGMECTSEIDERLTKNLHKVANEGSIGLLLTHQLQYLPKIYSCLQDISATLKTPSDNSFIKTEFPRIEEIATNGLKPQKCSDFPLKSYSQIERYFSDESNHDKAAAHLLHVLIRDKIRDTKVWTTSMVKSLFTTDAIKDYNWGLPRDTTKTPRLPKSFTNWYTDEFAPDFLSQFHWYKPFGPKSFAFFITRYLAKLKLGRSKNSRPQIGCEIDDPENKRSRTDSSECVPENPLRSSLSERKRQSS